MGCLFVVITALFPRFTALIFWIARPERFLAPFGGFWLWPLFGIMLLPYTTLLYVALWSPNVGLAGWDWLWLGLAVLLDVGHYAGSGYSNRDRMPSSMARL
jgi:hypothetical protein